MTILNVLLSVTQARYAVLRPHITIFTLAVFLYTVG